MLEVIVNFWNNHHDAIFELSRKAIASVIVLIISMFVSRFLKKLINKASSSMLNVNDNVFAIMHHIVSYGILIISVIMILNIFGVNTASLLAVLGAAGIAIGLALKDTLGNIAAGIILLFLGSFRQGEYIEFGAINGTVREVNLFTTILETPDGIYISAPNSSIWGNPLKNYTRNGKRRMEIPVGISYSDSIDDAFGVLREIIDSETRFLKEPAPQVIMQSMKDSSVTLCIRAWAENKDYWDIYWLQMRNVKEKIEEAGLHIPFPQQDVYVQMLPVK